MLHLDATLVDKYNPDLTPFDWEQAPLPYADDSFETVVCLDTLEHIDDFHISFNNLVRVARRHVIISLPNNWRRALKAFLKGRGLSVAYGIPPEKPSDRHKWFFNPEQFENFMFYQVGTRDDLVIRAVRYYMPMTRMLHRILYPLMSMLLPERYFKNFFVHTMFICFEKGA